MSNKNVRKFLKISGIIFLVLLLFVLAIPFLFKNKLIDLAKREINKHLKVEAAFGDADVWFLRTFPYITIKLDDITLDGLEDFEGIRLAEIKRTTLTMNVMNAFRSEKISIRRLALESPEFYFLINSNGNVNWDILIGDEEIERLEEDDESVELATLQSYGIYNGKLTYLDEELNMLLEFINVYHSGRGNFSSDIFELHTETRVDTFNAMYGGINYLRNGELDARVDLEVNMNEFSFTFLDNEAVLNDLPLAFRGFIAMPEDDIDLDISFESTRTDFKTILSLVPVVYTRDFQAVRTSGFASAKGRVFGKYAGDGASMPGFDLDVRVDNASFSYPDLPKSVEAIRFRAQLQSEGKRDYDDLVIRLTDGYLRFGGQPVVGNIRIATPFSDPDIDASLKGQINMADLGDIMPLEDGESYTGIVNADIELKGRISAIEQKRYNDFHAKGSFVIRDLDYISVSLPYRIQSPIIEFNVTPRYLELSKGTLMLGENDISATGYMDNYLNFIFTDELLKGSFDLTSQFINLNDLMTNVEIEGGDDSEPLQAIELPGNIDFTLNARAEEVVFDDLQLNNVKGTVQLKEKIASLYGFTMDVLGGSMKMNGTYNVQDISKPEIDIELIMDRLDINQSAVRFVTIEQFAPIAAKCTGLFSAKLTYNSLLQDNMKPKLTSIFSKGSISTNNLFIEGFEPLNELASKLNISRLAKQKIDDVKMIFKIEDGRMNVDPYQVKMGNINTTIAGYTSLEKDIYYKLNLDIPRSEFGTKANEVLDQLLLQAKNQGINVDNLQRIFADVTIEGKITSPKISIQLAEDGKDALRDLKDQVEKKVQEKVEEVKQIAEDKVSEVRETAEEKIEETKEQVRAELEKRANQVIAEAELQAQRIRREAKNAADKVVQESNEQADRLEKEATNPIEKRAAKIAADKIREEGKRNAERLEREAETRTQRIIDEANQKADRIRRGEEE
jgi:vacuolar-type H+-ATPase subunit E/Vma4